MNWKHFAIAGGAALVGMAGVSMAQHEDRHERIMEKADANGDGQISYEEAVDAMPGITQDRFSHLDANSDGAISEEELAARRGGKRGKHGARNPEAMRERFDAQDLNGDGKLSKEEMIAAFPRMVDEHFARADSDGDGGLSFEELAQAGPRRGHGGHGMRGGPMGKFHEADADGNGELSMEEIQTARPRMNDERFAKLDADQSGGLTIEEIMSARRVGEHSGRRSGEDRSAHIVQRLDTNGDGAISREESAAARGGRLTENFDTIDADGSGTLTAEELSAAIEARHGSKPH